MKWIELHLKNGIPIMVNLEAVTSIYIQHYDREGINTDTNPETAPTVICFAGTPENTVVVKEKYEKVKSSVLSAR